MKKQTKEKNKIGGLKLKDECHLVRYGTNAEQKFLIGDFLNCYDVIVVNGNMAAYTSSGLASFISEKAKNKAYIIDPVTHGFQQDINHLQNDDDEIKASVDKLVEWYGNPVKYRIENNETLIANDFSEDKDCESFSRNVLNFQRNVFKEEIEKEAGEYYAFADVELTGPKVLLAPYFYLNISLYDDWMEINKKLIEKSAEQLNEEELFAPLVIDEKLILDEKFRKNICEEYNELPIDGIFLWINNFDEKNASGDSLKKFIEFIRKFDIPVINSYGSYFSIVLTKADNINLKGVCHGPGYGEAREVYPVGGGLPRAKFYYPDVHKRLRYKNALNIAREYFNDMSTYYKNICECKLCKELVEEYGPKNAFELYGITEETTFKRSESWVTISYPTSETTEYCKKHYMYNKNEEFNTKANIKEIIELLEETHEAFSSRISSEISHCKIWADVFRDEILEEKRDEG